MEDDKMTLELGRTGLYFMDEPKTLGFFSEDIYKYLSSSNFSVYAVNNPMKRPLELKDSSSKQVCLFSIPSDDCILNKNLWKALPTTSNVNRFKDTRHYDSGLVWIETASKYAESMLQEGHKEQFFDYLHLFSPTTLKPPTALVKLVIELLFKVDSPDMLVTIHDRLKSWAMSGSIDTSNIQLTIENHWAGWHKSVHGVVCLGQLGPNSSTTVDTLRSASSLVLFDTLLSAAENEGTSSNPNSIGYRYFLEPMKSTLTRRLFASSVRSVVERHLSSRSVCSSLCCQDALGRLIRYWMAKPSFHFILLEVADQISTDWSRISMETRSTILEVLPRGAFSLELLLSALQLARTSGDESSGPTFLSNLYCWVQTGISEVDGAGKDAVETFAFHLTHLINAVLDCHIGCECGTLDANYLLSAVMQLKDCQQRQPWSSSLRVGHLLDTLELSLRAVAGRAPQLTNPVCECTSPPPFLSPTGPDLCHNPVNVDSDSESS